MAASKCRDATAVFFFSEAAHRQHIMAAGFLQLALQHLIAERLLRLVVVEYGVLIDENHFRRIRCLVGSGAPGE